MTYSDASFTPTAAAVLANVPTLVSSSPMDGTMTVSKDANIVLTFSEDVEPGASDKKIIIDATGALGADVEYFVGIGDSDGIVTFSGRTVTINPAVDLAGSASYAVKFEAGTILDKEGNSVVAVADATTLNFDVAPTLATAVAVDGTPAGDLIATAVTDFGANDSIKLTFTEDMKAGVGSIIISDGASDIRTIPVSDTNQVTFGVATTKTVTINPTANLQEGTTYFVQMASGTLTDTSGNAYAGISDTTTLDFKTADAAPTLLTATPALATAGSPAPNTNIVLNFSENVTAVSGKTVKIYSDTTASLITSIDAADPQISIVGKTVTINPTNNLVPNTKAHFVVIEAGAFEDSSGNDYAGLASTNATGLYFTPLGTDDVTAPTVAMLTKLTPADNLLTPGSVSVISIEFTEAGVGGVIPGTGVITIRSDDGTDVRTIDVNTGEGGTVTWDGAFKIATITPTVALADNTLYSVQIPGSAFTDNFNNAFAGFTDTTSWNFTTKDNDPVLLSSSPGDGKTATTTLATATPVAIDSDIILNFNEPVQGQAINIILTPTGGTPVTIAANDTTQVFVNGKTVTINPTADLLPNATYELTTAAALAFKDVDGTTFGGNAVITAGSGIDFKTTDTIAPVLAAINTKAAGIAAKSTATTDNLFLTFNEAVAKGSGNIIVTNVATGAILFTLDVNDPTVTVVTGTVTNDTIKIDPATAFAATTEYSVTFDGGVITDTAGNPAPTLVSSRITALVGDAIVATNGSFTATAEGNNFTLLFNEAVKAGNGDIIISDGAGDTRVIPVTDTNQVIFDTTAQTAIINPMFDLAPGVAYSITMGSGVITDLQGNAYDAPSAPTQGLSTDRIALLTAAQMPGLSADVITALSSDQVVALTPEAIGAMSSAQIAALDPYDVAAMSVEQFAAISTAGIAGLEASDIQALAQTPSATDRIAALTAEQMPKISGTTLAALSTTQIPALTSDAVAALSSVQLNSLTPTQLGHMTFEQFAALSSATVASLDA
ncbi:Ig-like domain-containing protein, partial [Chromatium okenii]|uniref:Ig-like domain-containing protein n=1 Tax=Chromatium okenii TaxID=61644 RepID=UPI0026EF8425